AARRSPRSISPGAAGATVTDRPDIHADTLAPVTQPWHLPPRYQPSERAVNRARTLVLPHSQTRAAANPSSLVNHRDPVTASHLTGGEPGPVARLARPPGHVHRDSREIP